ncbi:hypothetical protein H8959_005002, partial [Pygathrix nigripes]
MNLRLSEGIAGHAADGLRWNVGRETLSLTLITRDGVKFKDASNSFRVGKLGHGRGRLQAPGSTFTCLCNYSHGCGFHQPSVMGPKIMHRSCRIKELLLRGHIALVPLFPQQLSAAPEPRMELSIVKPEPVAHRAQFPFPRKEGGLNEQNLLGDGEKWKYLCSSRTAVN